MEADVSSNDGNKVDVRIVVDVSDIFGILEKRGFDTGGLDSARVENAILAKNLKQQILVLLDELKSIRKENEELIKECSRMRLELHQKKRKN